MKDNLHQKYLELAGSLVQKSLAVLLDNRSVNESEQILNGTKGLMESIHWIDKNIQRRRERMIRESIERGEAELILHIPPYFIMTSLADRKTHKTITKHALP